jgi:hypothetical protein
LLAELEEVIFVYERNARLLSNKHMCNLYWINEGEAYSNSILVIYLFSKSKS